ncbi:MAG: hypothetical protein H7Y09_15770 [Chitinophagaceae bacterium]|nr:hypothetical protein [Anaerolineae bacterium]
MIQGMGILGAIGMASISMALIVLAQLSRQLGHVTRAAPYYRGFYVASALVAVGAIARLVHINSPLAFLANLHHNKVWVLLYNGAPAAGVTLGVFLAWRYWSWLLAERD